MKNVEQVRRDLRRQLGREPEVQEIARILYAADPNCGQPPGRYACVQALANDLFPNEPPPEPESTRLLREKLDEILAPLSPQERAILEMRFGLQNGRPHTLDEVAHHLNHPEIRQIEAKALKKLRKPERSRWPR